MSDTLVKIRCALNGWSIDIQHDEEKPDRYVFSYDDAVGKGEEVKAFAALLSTLDNLIGPSTNRYSKHRVYVKVLPGDKHSDFKEEEESNE